ncbi:MAG: hypothetical protein J7K94_04305 [Dehalococcoidia bacterium]|nr:hypothetical protein [Dehalococcoidia bacterium]
MESKGKRRISFILLVVVLLSVVLLVGCGKPPAVLSVNPVSINFTVMAGQIDEIPAETLTITNSGGSKMNYSLSTDSIWISLSSLKGEVAPGTASEIEVTVNIYDMEVGHYSGIITVSALDNSPQTISVNLNVTPHVEYYETSFTLYLTHLFDDCYGSIDGVGFAIEEHQRVKLTWRAYGDSPKILVNLRGPGIERQEAFGEKSGTISFYCSSEPDKNTSSTLYPAGYYSVDFKIWKNVPGYPSSGSDAKIEVECSIEDVQV